MNSPILSADVTKNRNKNLPKVVKNATIFNRPFQIYGTAESPLFLAKDVAEMIEHSNPRMMVQSVDEDEKQCVNNPYALKGQQEQWFLTENGLYEVLMLSRKPIAKEFKKQVKYILHEIRMNGGYIAGQENYTPEELMAKALIVAQNTILEREKRIEQQDKEIQEKNQVIEIQKPKADFFDTFESSDFCEDIGTVGKILAMRVSSKLYGEKKIFTVLRDLGIIKYKFLADSKSYYVPCCGYEKYFVSRNTHYLDENGKHKFRPKLFVNPKGHIYLLKKFSKMAEKEIKETFEQTLNFGGANNE